MLLFIVFTVTLLSTAFSLGGTGYLYIRFRTRVLRLVLLFLLSLLFISIGFWINLLMEILYGGPQTGFETAAWLIHLLGGGLNIAVLPYFVSALANRAVHKRVRALLWIWNTIFIVLAFTVFLFPGFLRLLLFLSFQQVITILGALIFLAIRLYGAEKLPWKGALLGFFAVSGVFLLLLILDMLITLVPIEALAWFDNMSLPIYLITLTTGIFLFAGRFLSREAMLRAGKLTDECRTYYGLTEREAEIIEHLLSGSNNREIGDRLFISIKTVENHLYNIYRKIDVGSRTQLIGALRSWEREE